MRISDSQINRFIVISKLFIPTLSPLIVFVPMNKCTKIHQHSSKLNEKFGTTNLLVQVETLLPCTTLLVNLLVILIPLTLVFLDSHETVSWKESINMGFPNINIPFPMNQITRYEKQWPNINNINVCNCTSKWLSPSLFLALHKSKIHQTFHVLCQ